MLIKGICFLSPAVPGLRGKPEPAILRIASMAVFAAALAIFTTGMAARAAVINVDDANVWTETGPLFGGSVSGTDRAYYPSVAKVGSIYHIWYGDGANTRHATSTNADFSGYTFPAPAITGLVDNSYHPRVLYNAAGWSGVGDNADPSKVFLMYQTSTGFPAPGIHAYVSADGDDWTPVNAGAHIGVTTGGLCSSPSANMYLFEVLYEGPGQWKGYALNGTVTKFGYYTSADGINWTCSGNIMTTGYAAWEDGAAGWQPAVHRVLKTGNSYVLFFSGGSNSNQGIGMAVSTDGSSFSRSLSNPLFSTNTLPVAPIPSWRSTRTYTPDVIFDPEANTYRMYFTGLDAGGNYRIGMASSPGLFSRVQDAVNGSVDGDTIQVAAGVYNENIAIGNKTLTLTGAQAGADARARAAADPNQESIINTSGVALAFGAKRVTLDGFTIHRSPPPSTNTSYWGLNVTGNTEGFNIVNNIFEDLTVGMILTQAGSAANPASTVQHNLVRRMVAQTPPGALPGEGIYTQNFYNVTIDSNRFEDMSYSAIVFASNTFRNVTVSNNEVYRTQQQGIQAAGDCSNVNFTGNYIEQANILNLADKGGIRLYGANFTGAMNIEHNTVVNSYNGIAVKDNENITGKEIHVRYNKFINNSANGVYHAVGSGTLDASNNWWGDISGPGGAGPGTGQSITANVSADIWRTCDCVTDLTPPAQSAMVADGTATDIQYTSSASQLSANWTVASDADAACSVGAAIQDYQVSIGTTPGGADILAWTSAGNVAATTTTGLSLVDGQIYYVSTRAENCAGIYSAAAVSNGQTVDSSPPSAPASVRDGVEALDLDYSTSLTTLSANWDVSADAQSGIAGYYAAAGTTPGGTEIQGWTNTGAAASASFSALTLNPGVSYYFSVKALNGAGLMSSVATSDGITIGGANVCGDIDGNGRILSNDVLLLKRHIDGTLAPGLTAQQLASADVALRGTVVADGVIDEADMQLVAQAAIENNGLTPAGLTCPANP